MNKIFIIILTILLLASCKTQQTMPNIEFVQPEFEIVSIVIIQADLINTEFETTLKINNPNKFDLQLTSIKYELYGNGMFWAGGVAEENASIPAESSGETKFRFSMNFINMNRNLLDDVIAMRRVQYAFKGEAIVSNSRLRSFPFKFDIKGLSDVKPTANSR